MSLSQQQIQQMNQLTGLNKPATPAQATNQSRVQQLQAIAKGTTPAPSAPQTNGPNVLQETASNYGSQITGAIDKVTQLGKNAYNVGVDPSSTIIDKAKAVGEMGLGSAAAGVQAIFAPIAAPLQTLLSHADAYNKANPGIPGAGMSVQSPEAIAAHKQLTDWAQQHPELSKVLGDVFTVGTAALGSGALNTTIGDVVQGVRGAVSEGVGGLKNTANAAREAITGKPQPEDFFQGLIKEKGQLSPVDAQTAAWKDLQPKPTEANIKAYRDQGATNPKTLTQGVTLKPTAADSRVLEQVTPLYEDGTIKPNMTTEEKIGAIEGKSRELTQQIDNYVADNNKVINISSKYPEVNSLDKALAKAKSGNSVIFAGDKSVEGAYDAVTNEFKAGLTKGSPTTSDLVSLRSRLKAFDAEMQRKFPNVYKNARTGEMNPTDNARFNAIRDVHDTVKNFISDELGPNNPYTKSLEQVSGLIRAGEMVNEGASNVSKLEAFATFIKNHPYFAGAAGWETLKHTISPGLPGI